MEKVLDDALLGKLEYSPDFKWYEGNAAWLDSSVTICIKAIDDQSFALILVNAHKVWSDREAWNSVIIDFVSDKLLPVKNEDWRDDDEDEITNEEFKSIITIRDITFLYDDYFEVWFDDGELFGGHSILVRCTLAHGPSEAQIAG